MMTRNVLAKGQIVIPKAIRELMGINVGDAILMDIENRKIIISKKEDVVEIFLEVCEANSRKISMKGIKRELERRY